MNRVTLLLVLVSALVLPGVAFRDHEWDCAVEVDIGHIERSKNNLMIQNSEISTSGVLFPASYDPVPFRFEFDLGGRGAYSLTFSENVTEVTLWSNGVEVYRGVPISSFAMPTGHVGVMVEAHGRARFKVVDRCSIQTSMRRFW